MWAYTIQFGLGLIEQRLDRRTVTPYVEGLHIGINREGCGQPHLGIGASEGTDFRQRMTDSINTLIGNISPEELRHGDPQHSCEHLRVDLQGLNVNQWTNTFLSAVPMVTATASAIHDVMESSGISCHPDDGTPSALRKPRHQQVPRLLPSTNRFRGGRRSHVHRLA